MIVLDTCALLWWTLEPRSLSARASKACARIETEGGIISAISIWEAGLKAKRGDLDLGTTINNYANRVKKISGLQIAAVDEKNWIESLELEWPHRDPADRVIVALASAYHCGLVTKDQMIRDFYAKSIW